MKFVDVKNDVAFRKIFGNEKKTISIISFLNAALKLEGDKRIRAKDEKGRQFIIEMQVADIDGFGKRVQYYTCRDYSMQIKRGENYPLLKPTHFVGILDFSFFDSPHYLSHHIIVNGETYEHKLKDIQFTFIELKKFNLKESELKTLIEKWVYFIKNAEDLNIIPDNVDDKGLREAYIDADLHNWDKDEWIEYDNSGIAIQDEKGRITIAEKKAIEKVVERCWRKNMKLEDIAEITELTIEEVKEIIEQLKNS